MSHGSSNSVLTKLDEIYFISKGSPSRDVSVKKSPNPQIPCLGLSIPTICN